MNDIIPKASSFSHRAALLTDPPSLSLSDAYLKPNLGKDSSTRRLLRGKLLLLGCELVKLGLLHSFTLFLLFELALRGLESLQASRQRHRQEQAETQAGAGRSRQRHRQEQAGAGRSRQVER